MTSLPYVVKIGFDRHSILWFIGPWQNKGYNCESTTSLFLYCYYKSILIWRRKIKKKM